MTFTYLRTFASDAEVHHDIENEVLTNFTDEHALSSYVEKNADVYFRKWDNESSAIRKQ